MSRVQARGANIGRGDAARSNVGFAPIAKRWADVCGSIDLKDREARLGRLAPR